MELADEDLSNMILKQKLLNKRNKEALFDESFVLKVLFQVLQGLKYLHRAQILHRDIKPLNILMRQGDCMLADFGVARQLEHSQ